GDAAPGPGLHPDQSCGRSSLCPARSQDQARRPALRLAALPGRTLGRIFRHPMGRVGASIVLAFVAIAVLAPLIAPSDPALQDFDELTAPSLMHWLGTDQFGRDVLTRVLYASRSALLVGCTAAALGGSVGVVAGLLAGYFQNWIDTLAMRAADIVLAFP